MNNIFANLPDASNNEVFQTLTENGAVRIERIISLGQTTPEGDWYDQEWDEWVFLLSGGAKLQFHGNDVTFSLTSGDYMLIPSHQRHRVTWTDPERPTVWLAVHIATDSVNG